MKQYQLGLNKNEVALVPYQDSWKKSFLQEKALLEQALGVLALRIEHVGSTSVEGLSAKPIIDIAVGVADEAALYQAMPLLTKAGFDVLDSIQTEGEVLARKGPPECRTCYIHLEVLNGTRWQNQILFRDYLQAHPEAVTSYEQLKQKLALTFANERKKYTAAKTDFILDIIEKAHQTK